MVVMMGVCVCVCMPSKELGLVLGKPRGQEWMALGAVGNWLLLPWLLPCRCQKGSQTCEVGTEPPLRSSSVTLAVTQMLVKPPGCLHLLSGAVASQNLKSEATPRCPRLRGEARGCGVCCSVSGSLSLPWGGGTLEPV